jgi:hypothetical protein
VIIIALSKEEKLERSNKRKQDKYDKEHMIIDNKIHKWCKVCLNWIEMNDNNFYKNKKNSTDGYHPECKRCSIKRTVKWQEENPEHYYDIVCKRDKNPSPKRLKTINIGCTKQRLNGYNREWARKNPDKMRGYRLTHESNKTHKISKKELNELYKYADFKCMFCDITEEYSKYYYGEKLHKDHAINNGSNGIDNCILACKGCNSSKHTKDWDEWFTPNNPIYDENNYNRIKEWFNKFNTNN